MKTTKCKPKRGRRLSEAHGSATYHLYYRLPWSGAAVGMKANPKYQIHRSDTEHLVTTCATKEQAEALCESWPNTLVRDAGPDDTNKPAG